MARIRTVKPEFWSSEQVMACAPISRLLFIGLWNFSDDAGRIRDAAKSIKAQIFPGDDDVLSENVRLMIDDLSTNGLLRKYEVDGKAYLQVTGWQHQKIDRPRASKHPAPPPLETSTNDRRGLASDLILSNPTDLTKSTARFSARPLASALPSGALAGEVRTGTVTKRPHEVSRVELDERAAARRDADGLEIPPALRRF